MGLGAYSDLGAYKKFFPKDSALIPTGRLIEPWAHNLSFTLCFIKIDYVPNVKNGEITLCSGKGENDSVF